MINLFKLFQFTQKNKLTFNITILKYTLNVSHIDRNNGISRRYSESLINLFLSKHAIFNICFSCFYTPLIALYCFPKTPN